MSYINLVLKLLVVLVMAYNAPIGMILLGYLVLTELSVKRWPLDLLVFLVVLVLGVMHFDWLAITNQPKLVYAIYKKDGIVEIARYELFHFKQSYEHGLFIVLVIPLLWRNFGNWYYKIAHRKLVDTILQKINEKDVDGVTIGQSSGKNLVLSDKELNQHSLIIGTTGSGKTTTILNFVESAASRSIPVIYLDGKGSFDLINKLQRIADAYGRVFKVFTLRPKESIKNLAGYNPFSSGNATEWKNRIMSLFAQAEGKGQEHFSLGEQNYINFVANVLAKFSKPIDLRVVLAFLENPDKLLALAHEVDRDLGLKLAKLHNDADVSKLIGDVIKLLELFIYSDYGKLFNTIGMDNVIKLRESIQNNEIVLFLFDASTYAEDTRKVAKMVINDINSCFADLEEFKKCYCIFDEFASYASENLAETISLHRSNGMHAVIGTQSIATVKLKAPETKRVAEELIACCSTYIVQAINHAEDAELLAKVMGTRKTYEVTAQIDSNQGGSTGVGTVKHVDEFKIHPQAIKELKTGEAIIYRKAAGINNPVKVKIRSIR